MILMRKKIEFIKFNELCNIGNVKWVLGDAKDNINIQSLEDRTDIIARLIGSLDDLGVANTDLEYFDISPYFNFNQTMEL
jgi:hypothetical protein